MQGKFSEQIDFQQMDAQKLNFPDEKFDVIVTRNLTWNLENPQQAIVMVSSLEKRWRFTKF